MKLKPNGFARIVRNGMAAALLAAFSLGAIALPPGTNEEILERIRPIGSLNVAESASGSEGDGAGAQVADAGEPRSGQQVYDNYCMACHAAGVAGAPAFGNDEAWAPRLEKGMDTLYASTINGLNIMPPRGTCSDCSDEELRASVDYMVDALN